MKLQNTFSLISLIIVLFMLSVTIVSADAKYCAQYLNLPPTATLTVNTTTTMQVKVTNCGSLTWPANSQFRLAYHWYIGTQEVVHDGLRTNLPTTINPNGSITLYAVLQTPANAGNYTLKWDMLQETVTWFSSKNVPTGNVSVSIVNAGAASITVDKPANNNDWLRGTTKTIFWSSNGPVGNQVRITLMDTSLTQTVQVIANSAPNTTSTGSFNWPIAAGLNEGSYRIRILSISNANIFGDSAIFKIVKDMKALPLPPGLHPRASIRVIKPDSSKHWITEMTYGIIWAHSGPVGNQVRILLMDPSLTQTVHVIADSAPNSAPNSGSFNWSIPAEFNAGTFRIRIISVSDAKIFGDSDVFQIDKKLKALLPFKPPDIIFPVTKPAKNSVYNINDVVPIEWETKSELPYPASKFVVTVYSRDGHTKITELFSESPSLSGGIEEIAPKKFQLNWMYTGSEGIPSGYYTIRITTADTGNTHIGFGNSQEFKLTRPLETVLETIPVEFHNWWCAKGVNTGGGPHTPFVQDIPGDGLVGFYYNYIPPEPNWDSGWAFLGFVHRSLLTFNLDKVKTTGRKLIGAWIYIKIEQTSHDTGFSSEGGIPSDPIVNSCIKYFYILTGPIGHICPKDAIPASTPYAIPDSPEYQQYIPLHIAEQWLNNKSTNYGVLLTGYEENFIHADWWCVNWFKAWLNLQFTQEK